MVLKTVTTFLTTIPLRKARKHDYENILMSVCIYILVMEMCERLCYYGLTGSLKVLLQSRFDYSSFQASALTNVLPAFVYLTPLLGGYVADEIWGRFKTIFLFGIVYIIGTSMMSYAVYPGRENKTLFMLGLFGLLSLGAGGIKANVVTLGGDQFDDSIKEHKEQKEKFFNYFYWMINIGAAISYGYLAQMATNGSGSISKQYGFFWSFTICTIALMLAIIAFLSASGRYILHPPSGGTMGKFFSVFRESLATAWQAWAVLIFAIIMGAGFVISVAAAFVQDDALNRQLAISGCVLAGAGVFAVGALTIDTEWVRGQSERDMALSREFWRVMPAIMCGTSFWVAYGQMSGNFYAQSCQMDLSVGGGTQLNAAVLNIADCIAIIVCIPFFDKILYPFIERCKGSRFTVMQKMGCGFIVACLSLVAAAIIEIERRKSGVPAYQSDSASYSNCAPTFPDADRNTCDENGEGFEGKGTCMSRLSVFWMLIPYFLIGVGECLISVQVYKICYNEVPEEMRSTAQAVNLFTTGLANAIAAGLTVAFQNDIPDDLNNGKLERPYYAIAAIQFLTFLLFIYAVRNFEYKNKEESGDFRALEDGEDQESKVKFLEDEGRERKDSQIAETTSDAEL